MSQAGDFEQFELEIGRMLSRFIKEHRSSVGEFDARSNGERQSSLVLTLAGQLNRIVRFALIFKIFFCNSSNLPLNEEWCRSYVNSTRVCVGFANAPC